MEKTSCLLITEVVVTTSPIGLKFSKNSNEEPKKELTIQTKSYNVSPNSQ